LPTATDANLVLGYIGADGFNGGAMTLDVDAARRAIATVADPLGLSVEQAAWGIHALATNNMERALRIVSIERGRDPRAYTMVAFGGAGPLHAARLARQAAVREVLVPFGAGVGSAVGLLTAVPKLDVLITRVLPLGQESQGEIHNIYAALAERLEADAARLGAKGEAKFARIAYMRYRGQGFEIKVSLDDGPIDEAFIESAKARFVETYRRIYGGIVPDTGIEATDWQLVWQASGQDRRAGSPSGRGGTFVTGRRDVYFPELGGYKACPLYRRRDLAPGDDIDGPAIIVENETSTVLLPGDRAEITAQANLRIRIGGPPASAPANASVPNHP
jgi:N-methylhydantoinase A